MGWASAGGAIIASRIAAAPKNPNFVICLLHVIDPMFGPSQSKTGLGAAAFPESRSRFGDRSLRKPGVSGRANSKQRRHLPCLERAEIHRAVGKAQREGAGLFAFQHGFPAERVDAGGDTD